MIHKLIATPMIYLIRHARSCYNIAEHELQQKFNELSSADLQKTPEYLQMKFNLKLEDCDVYQQIGLAQCKQCQQKMSKVDVDVVIVSPMRRALTTCALVFKDHKSKAPIIVDPLFRQIMESGCDIGSRLRQSMKDYPDFDYSLIKNIDYWYIESLRNEAQRKQLLAKLNENQEDINKVAKELMLQYLKDLWKRRQEKPELKLDALSPVELQKQKLKVLLQKYKSIAIVTHSQNIKSYTGIKPPNCSIMKFKPQYFDLPVDKVPHDFL